MDLFFVTLLAGLAIGSIYGLVGVGYTIIFNATRVFNLAQGDLVMVGVMGSYFLLDVVRTPTWVAFPAVVVFVAMIAGLEERFIVRPFLGRAGSASFGWFIATLGFSAAIESIVTASFGDHPIVGIPSPVPLSGFRVGSIVLGYRQLLVIGSFLIIIAGLDFFYRTTWTGRAMRATAEDREAAGLRGVNPIAMSRLSFIMAGLAAGVAGFLIAPIVFSNPSVGLNFTLKGFVALAIGGFGSLRGAVLGGLLLGVSEQMFDTYVSAQFEILVALILLTVVLNFKTEGLFPTSSTRNV
jgi:branched-chain amino acid transport system permease protein